MTTTFVNEPIVPVELQLPTGSVMTLYQPGWQHVDDGSQAFLGRDGKVLGFPDLASLQRYAVSGEERHDLTSSPYLESVQGWDVDKYAEELCVYDLSSPPELRDGHLDEEEQASLGSTLALLLDLLDYLDVQNEHADALRDDHEVEKLAAGEQVGGLFSSEKRRQHVVDLIRAHWGWCVSAVSQGIERATSDPESTDSAAGAGDGTPIEDLVDAVTVWFAFAEQGAYTLRTTTLHDGRPNYLGRYASGSMSLIAATDVDTLRAELGSGKAGTLPGVRLPNVQTHPDLSLTPADDFIFDLVEIGEAITPAMSVDQADKLVTAWSELSRLTLWGRWAEVGALLGSESPIGRFMVTVAIDRAQDRPGSAEALRSADTKAVQDAWGRLVEAVYAHVHLIDVP